MKRDLNKIVALMRKAYSDILQDEEQKEFGQLMEDKALHDVYSDVEDDVYLEKHFARYERFSPEKAYEIFKKQQQDKDYLAAGGCSGLFYFTVVGCRDVDDVARRKTRAAGGIGKAGERAVEIVGRACRGRFARKRDSGKRRFNDSDGGRFALVQARFCSW